MAGKEGAKVRASGIRHTTTPWLWGTDGDIQPQPGHNLEYVIAMVPQEGTLDSLLDITDVNNRVLGFLLPL